MNTYLALIRQAAGDLVGPKRRASEQSTRYFFHLGDDRNAFPDPVGLLLQDDRQALTIAKSFIADLRAPMVDEPAGDFDGWYIQICRTDGCVVAILPIASVEGKPRHPDR